MRLFGNGHISLHLYWISWVLRNNGCGIKMVDAIYLKRLSKLTGMLAKDIKKEEL